MINWIIGGIIVIATGIIVIRYIIRLKNGKGGCDCSGCDRSNCYYNTKLLGEKGESSKIL